MSFLPPNPHPHTHNHHQIINRFDISIINRKELPSISHLMLEVTISIAEKKEVRKIIGAMEIT